MKVRKFHMLGVVAALVALIGVASFDSRPALGQVVASTATKTCTATAGATTFTCTLTITAGTEGIDDNVAAPGTGPTTLTITLTGNAAYSTTTPPVLTGTCPAAGGATLGTVTATTITLTAVECLAGETIIVTETLTVTGAGGGPLSQAVAGGVAPSNIAVTATATGFTVPGPAVTSVAISCAPTTLNPGFAAVPSQPVPPSGATSPPNPATGGAAGNAGVLFSLCTLDFNDNGATPTTVASGLVVITVQGGAAANAVTLFSNPGTSTTDPVIGPTNQLRINCPPPSSGPRTPAADSCDTVSFFVTLRPGVDPVLGPFGATTLRVTYDPDVDAANSGLSTDLAGPSVVAPPAPALRQPGFRVICTSSVDPAFGLGAAPGQLPLGTVLGDPAGTGAPFAIGTLPGGVPCQIQADADLTTTIVDPSAPGTIEVSALNGGLLDASGRFSTNLRIGCGDVPSLAAGVINLNTCVGVRFTVFGAGVGLVEVRFRYEPAAIAQAAGILEDEGAFTVGFVAPRADVSLLLNPNPVTVGATGTATARFNRTGLCAAGVVCIDPTTGLPITVTAGTILNGTVVFTIDNSAIASWVGAQTATTTPVSQTGFITSANQATVRCGFFPTTTAPVQFTLGSFFGGCFEVAATYRGNAPGVTNVTATFTPDLPSASLLPFFTNIQAPTITNQRALEVVGAAPVGDVQLSRGCNNVSPTVTEAASAYAARVNPTSALVAIWEHQAATNTFRGYSPQAGAPNDLSGVTRLRPVFVCTSGAATLGQPAA